MELPAGNRGVVLDLARSGTRRVTGSPSPRATGNLDLQFGRQQRRFENDLRQLVPPKRSAFADRAGHEKNRRRTCIAFENRLRADEDIAVAVVKGDRGDIPGNMPSGEFRSKPAQRHDTALLHQRFDLLGKPFRPDGKLPRVVSHARHPMVHQDDRVSPLDKAAGEPAELLQRSHNRSLPPDRTRRDDDRILRVMGVELGWAQLALGQTVKKRDRRQHIPVSADANLVVTKSPPEQPAQRGGG